MRNHGCLSKSEAEGDDVCVYVRVCANPRAWAEPPFCYIFSLSNLQSRPECQAPASRWTAHVAGERAAEIHFPHESRGGCSVHTIEWVKDHDSQGRDQEPRVGKTGIELQEGGISASVNLGFDG